MLNQSTVLQELKIYNEGILKDTALVESEKCFSFAEREAARPRYFA